MGMSEASVLDAASHRKVAVDLFNMVWDYMEKPNRTVEESDHMLHAAHASRYHWELVGTPLNLARGEWQVSRVYTVLGRAEPAQYHARRCLEITLANGYGDFDLAFAYEAMARAAKVAGDMASCAQYVAKAEEACNDITSDEDRKVVEADLASLRG